MATRFHALLRRTAPLLAALALLPGCASYRLEGARSDFYAGRPADAAQRLAEENTSGRDRVLVLMERGMARLAAHDYAGSAADFIQAHDELEKMTAIQVAQDTTSLVINDTVQDYRGPPFERTLLHAFAALDHLAVGNWENAAVEARRILISLSPESKGDYPDDAYSRYLAGFCLQLVDDDSNAALQFRKAAEIATSLVIDDRTGRIAPAGAKPPDDKWPAELVCFIFVGRGAQGAKGSVQRLATAQPHYAEIVHEGKVLGRSQSMADTIDLAFTSDQKEAAKKLVKTATRIAVKETVAHQFDHDNAALAELIRFVLIGILEQPDARRWETLPRWLQVARVPCPPDLKSFDVTFKNSAGMVTRTVHVDQPLQRRRNTFVSFCREL